MKVVASSMASKLRECGDMQGCFGAGCLLLRRIGPRYKRNMRELSVARPHDLMLRFSINFFRDQKGQVGGTYTLCFRCLPDAALPRGGCPVRIEPQLANGPYRNRQPHGFCASSGGLPFLAPLPVSNQPLSVFRCRCRHFFSIALCTAVI